MGKRSLDILKHLFNLLQSQGKVIVLVPKESHPCSPNNYRPIALTSHIMKILERLLLVHFSKQASTFENPLQFAYCCGIEVEDAIIHLLQRTHSHLDKPGHTSRIMLILFLQ